METSIYEELPEGKECKTQFINGLNYSKKKSGSEIELSEEEINELFIVAAEMYLNYDYFDEYVTEKAYRHWYCSHYEEEAKDFREIGIKFGKAIFAYSIKPFEINACESPFAVAEAILEKDPVIIKRILQTKQIYASGNYLIKDICGE